MPIPEQESNCIHPVETITVSYFDASGHLVFNILQAHIRYTTCLLCRAWWHETLVHAPSSDSMIRSRRPWRKWFRRSRR